MAEFSFAAAGDVGLGLLGGLTKGLSALSAQGISEANAEAANKIRAGQNEVERSKRNLAGVVRDINNDRLLVAASKNLDTLTVNAIRTSDSFAKGNFEQSIKDAEQMGVVAARASASGLGGSSIASIGRTVALTQARAEQARADRQGDIQYDQSQATVDVLSNALKSTSTAPLTANMQYGVNTPAAGGDGIAGALLRGLIDKKDSLKVLLGSMEPNSAQTKPTLDVGSGADSRADFAFEEAVSFPVTDSNVQPLGQINYVDRSDRLLLNATLN